MASMGNSASDRSVTTQRGSNMSVDSWYLHANHFEAPQKTSPTSPTEAKVKQTADKRPHVMRQVWKSASMVIPEPMLVLLTGHHHRDHKKDHAVSRKHFSASGSVDCGDPLQKIHIPKDDEVLCSGDKTEIDTYVDQFKLGRAGAPVVAENWFTEGTSMYEWRAVCKRIAERPWFNTVFTTLILVNSLTLGASVDGDLDPFTTWLLECIFTLAYLVEIFVSGLGSSGRPWLSLSFMFDLVLVVIAVFDVWLMYLLEYLGIYQRPQMSVLMCFRLFRFSRLINAANHMAEFARPVRLLKGALLHTPDVFVGVVLVALCTFFICAIALMSSAKELDDPTIDTYFPSAGEAMLTFTMTLSKQMHCKTITVQLDEVLNGGVTSAGFRVVLYLLKFVLFCIVLSVFVESFYKEGSFDDQLQFVRTKQKEFDRNRIKDLLEGCVPETHEEKDSREPKAISANNLAHCLMHQTDRGGYMWKHHAYIQLFAMTADDVVQLLKDTDRKKEGSVTVNSFLLQMFQKRCADRHISELLTEHGMRVCKHQMAQCYDTLAEFQSTLNSREDRPEDGNHPIHPKRENHRGMTQSVKLTLSAIVECRAESESLYWTISNQIHDLIEEAKNLKALIHQTDWTDEETVPEAAIKIASVQFESNLERTTAFLRQWSKDTLKAQAELNKLVETKSLPEDLHLPECTICHHRHPGATDTTLGFLSLEAPRE